MDYPKHWSHRSQISEFSGVELILIKLNRANNLRLGEQSLKCLEEWCFPFYSPLMISIIFSSNLPWLSDFLISSKYLSHNWIYLGQVEDSGSCFFNWFLIFSQVAYFLTNWGETKGVKQEWRKEFMSPCYKYLLIPCSGLVLPFFIDNLGTTFSLKSLVIQGMYWEAMERFQRED